MPELYLIDKAKLLSDIWDDLAFLEGAPVSARDAAKYLDNLVRKQPTIEAATVRHGRWVYDETIGGMKHYYCTSCKECDPGNECFADENQILWFAFCPKCGARMDGGAEDG